MIIPLLLLWIVVIPAAVIAVANYSAWRHAKAEPGLTADGGSLYATGPERSGLAAMGHAANPTV